jgi:hypothetical protein
VRSHCERDSALSGARRATLDSKESKQKVAGSQGVASNDLSPSELHFLTSEELLAELKNWETQLKDVDFSVLDNPIPRMMTRMKAQL